MAQNPMLPNRYPNRDLFVFDVFDTLPYFKDDQASMEHPVFSLSTKPDYRIRHYEHNGKSLTVEPGFHGLATIHDKDVLLYCASHLRAGMADGKEPSQTVRFIARDLLVLTNRLANGRSYERLEATLDRLNGTVLKTNIKTGGVQIEKGFGIIDSWEIIKEDSNGRMIALEVKLSDWLYNAIMGNEMLTISRDYFRLRKPLDRRIYELARKHCGDQKSAKISLAKLHKKVGSTAILRKFRAQMVRIAESDHLPDYSVKMVDDMITFKNRKRQAVDAIEASAALPHPHPATIEEMKKAAPGWDVYSIWESFKRKVWRDGMPKNTAAAAIGYAKKVGQTNPK